MVKNRKDDKYIFLFKISSCLNIQGGKDVQGCDVFGVGNARCYGVSVVAGSGSGVRDVEVGAGS
jgi:hypothetical protein